MARRKKGRLIDGIVLLDKPVGMSSNHALQRVKRLYDANKAGHTGSLDPLASGMLPICLGEATKVSSWLLHSDKYYRVVADLRFETTTGDREGEPTRYSPNSPPERAVVEATLQNFLGVIEQIPPMYSALKHQGQPLYKLARRGKSIERPARQVTIHQIDLENYADGLLTLHVHVSRGTYIRTLVEDIAKAWGGAAHVNLLHRTGVAAYEDMPMLTLEQLECLAETGFEALDTVLMPCSQALADWPVAKLDAAMQRDIAFGRRIRVPARLARLQGQVKIMGTQDEFLGLGEIDNTGVLHPKRMFVRPLR